MSEIINYKVRLQKLCLTQYILTRISITIKVPSKLISPNCSKKVFNSDMKKINKLFQLKPKLILILTKQKIK